MKEGLKSPGPSCLCVLTTVLCPGVLAWLGSRDETHSREGKGGTWPSDSLACWLGEGWWCSENHILRDGLALILQIRKQAQREASCPMVGI